MIHKFHKTTDFAAIRTGSLLISTPVNKKYNNSKLLILVTQHNETGTTGVILNQVAAGEKLYKSLHGQREPVELQYGGPDFSQTLSYLVIYPSIKNGWKDSVFWSYDLLDVLTILHFMSDYNVQVNVYKGCIRWEPEELMEQLENKLWWLTNDYHTHSIIHPGSSTWQSYAKQHGGYYANLVEHEIPVNYN